EAKIRMGGRDVPAAPADPALDDVEAVVGAAREHARQRQRDAADAAADVEHAMLRLQAMAHQQCRELLADAPEIARPDVAQAQRREIGLILARDKQPEIDVGRVQIAAEVFESSSGQVAESLPARSTTRRLCDSSTRAR